MDGNTNSNQYFEPNTALIDVIADAGSTVTFSKNGILYKKIDSFGGRVDPNNELLAHYYYYVDSIGYGEWSITSSHGTDFLIQRSVQVSENKIYTVYAAAKTWVYYNGTFYNELTGGFVARARKLRSDTASAKAPTITQYNDHFHYSLTKGGGTYQSVNMIDMSKYSTMCCEIIDTVEWRGQVRFAAENGTGEYWDNTCPAKLMLSASPVGEPYVCRLDISAVNVNCRILFGSSWGNGTIEEWMYKIWLEE